MLPHLTISIIFFANERLKSQLAKQAMEGTEGDQLKSNRKYWRLREKGESNSPKHSCNCVDPFSWCQSG